MEQGPAYGASLNALDIALKLMHIAFSGLVFVLLCACVPSLVMWFTLTLLAFGRLATPTDWFFALMVLPAGWWGWASLVWASCSSTSFPDKGWPLWVYWGLVAGFVVAVGLSLTGSGVLRLPSLFALALTGGPCVLLTLILFARAGSVRIRQGAAGDL